MRKVVDLTNTDTHEVIDFTSDELPVPGSGVAAVEPYEQLRRTMLEAPVQKN